MNPWDKAAGDDNRIVSVCVLIPAILGVAAAWGVRRWWSNTLPLNSHAISRRRKIARDPAAGRRPPVLPPIVNDRKALRPLLQLIRSDTPPTWAGCSKIGA